MAASEFRFFIIGQDKSEEAAKKVEARYSRLGKRLEGFGRAFDRFGLRNPLAEFGKGFDDFGRAGAGAVRTLGEGEEAIGGFAAMAGEAIPVVGALALGTAAAARAAVMLGRGYADATFDVAQASRMLGASGKDIQDFRAAGAAAGVGATAMDQALGGLSKTMQDAVAGRNQTALLLMNKFGIQLHRNADGSVDATRAMMDLAGAMDQVHGAQRKTLLADIMGVSSALPILMRGKAALDDYVRDYERSGAALSQEDERRGEQFNRDRVRLHWQIQALKNDLGRAAEGPMDWGTNFLTGRFSALDNWVDGFRERVHEFEAGLDSLKHTIEGWAGFAAFAASSLTPFAWLGMISPRDLGRGAKERAAALLGDPANAGTPKVAKKPPALAGPSFFDRLETWGGSLFDGFAAQIEHQESRGRQFDRHGRPLVSPAGAIGVMQLEPDTARQAAARLKLQFDQGRLEHDADYNRTLGREELRFLLQKYRGDMTLAAAAYNAGPHRVDRWLRRFGDPRAGEISDAQFADRIPHRYGRQFEETYRYVQAFTHAPKAAPPPAERLADPVFRHDIAFREIVLPDDGPVRQQTTHHHIAHHHAGDRAEQHQTTHHHHGLDPAKRLGLAALESPLYARLPAQRDAGPALAATPASWSPDAANPVRTDAPAQRVTVEIVHRNAPAGTVTRVQASSQVDVSLRTEKAMSLETAA